MARKRLLLTLALVVVALIATVPTSALRVASIDNSSIITVSQSDVAGLAVSASSGNSVNQVTYSAGQVQVHFGKGNGGSAFSLQQGRTQTNVSVAADSVKMLGVLKVTNNSGYCQDVAVWVSSGSAINLTNIYGRPSGGAQPGTPLGTAMDVVKLQPAGYMLVDFWWTATTPAGTAGNFTLSVQGTRVATCP